MIWKQFDDLDEHKSNMMLGWMRYTEMLLVLLVILVAKQGQEVQGWRQTSPCQSLSTPSKLQFMHSFHASTSPTSSYPHHKMMLFGQYDDTDTTVQSGVQAVVSKLTKFTKAIAGTPQYTVAEVLITLAFLSGVDGAFSGDWSRYGIITKEVEDVLRVIMTIALAGHLFLGVWAGQLAASRGHPALPAALRTALVGVLSFAKVWVQTDDDAVRFPTVKDVKQALTSMTAGEYNAVQINQKIDNFITSAPVVMFSFSKCPYCLKGKQILRDELKVEVQVMELDQDLQEGSAVRSELAKRTGRTSVPSIWVNGEFIGGCNDGPQVLERSKIQTAGGLVALVREGQFMKLLNNNKQKKKAF